MNASSFTAKLFQILGLIALAFVIAIAQVTPAFAQSGTYPLAGATYQAQNFSGVRLPAYDSVWTADGRNWQPTLPSGPQRVAFAVSIEIMPGEYVANGVACNGYLDEARNGQGSSNRQVFNHENGKTFTVKTADGQKAWMLIECDGGTSSGYDIWATNPTYSGTAISQPNQPNNEPVAPSSNPISFIWSGWNMLDLAALFWLFVQFMILFIALIWVFGCANYAFVRFSARYGGFAGFLAAMVTLFLVLIPCIGFPLMPLWIWLATKRWTATV